MAHGPVGQTLPGHMPLLWPVERDVGGDGAVANDHLSVRDDARTAER
jgi:hypothetical protein